MSLIESRARRVGIVGAGDGVEGGFEVVHGAWERGSGRELQQAERACAVFLDRAGDHRAEGGGDGAGAEFSPSDPGVGHPIQDIIYSHEILYTKQILQLDEAGGIDFDLRLYRHRFMHRGCSDDERGLWRRYAKKLYSFRS